jgi:AcrR family transcriptional regulator
MGIANRKEREKEELRNRILQAALELFQEKGYEHTSLRAIAEKIEYSPTTIYLYFKDKDALFFAMHQAGFELLKEGFMPLMTIADPFDRLIAQGYGYIDFALKNPQLYDLMFVSDKPIDWLEDCEEEWNDGENAFAILKANVEQCMALGYMPRTDVEVLSFMIWSTLHGMITLHLHKRCENMFSPDNQGKLVHKGYETFVHSLTMMRNSQPASAQPTLAQPQLAQS